MSASESWSRSKSASLNNHTLRSATTCEGTESLSVAVTGLWSSINGRTPAFTPGKLQCTGPSRCLLGVGSQTSSVRPSSLQTAHSSWPSRLQPLPMVDLEVIQHDTTHGVRSMQLSLFLEATDGVEFPWSGRAVPASDHVKPLSECMITRLRSATWEFLRRVTR